jgi:hypothetical protein
VLGGIIKEIIVTMRDILPYRKEKKALTKRKINE